jgi:hypothetical protein
MVTVYFNPTRTGFALYNQNGLCAVAGNRIKLSTYNHYALIDSCSTYQILNISSEGLVTLSNGIFCEVGDIEDFELVG